MSPGEKASAAWRKAMALQVECQRAEWYHNTYGHPIDARKWKKRRESIARLKVFAKRLARERLRAEGFPDFPLD